MSVTVAVEISKTLDTSEAHDSPERIARAKAKFGHITSNTETLLSFLDVEEDRDITYYSSVEEMNRELMREIEEEDRAHSSRVV